MTIISKMADKPVLHLHLWFGYKGTQSQSLLNKIFHGTEIIQILALSMLKSDEINLFISGWLCRHGILR